MSLIPTQVCAPLYLAIADLRWPSVVSRTRATLFSRYALRVLRIAHCLCTCLTRRPFHYPVPRAQAGARLCKCMGEEFIPYLPLVMPSLITSASADPDVQVGAGGSGRGRAGGGVRQKWVWGQQRWG